MRTLRNVTFVVFCAMVYLAPALASSSSCWADPSTLGCAGGGGTFYVGQCGNCSEGFDFAISTCGNLSISEYFCDEVGGGYLRFCCLDPVMD